MNEITANDEFERFRSGADKYAAYLETPEGRLRLDLAFANLQEFLPRGTQSLHALDLGAGTVATAVRLARLGLHVPPSDLPIFLPIRTSGSTWDLATVLSASMNRHFTRSSRSETC